MKRALDLEDPCMTSDLEDPCVTSDLEDPCMISDFPEVTDTKFKFVALNYKEISKKNQRNLIIKILNNLVDINTLWNGKLVAKPQRFHVLLHAITDEIIDYH